MLNLTRSLYAIALILIAIPLTCDAQDLPKCNATNVVTWKFGVNYSTEPDVPEADGNYPSGFAVDDKGFIYVADGVNYELLKFSPDGKLVWKTSLQSGPTARPKSGYEVTSVNIAPNNQILVLNQSFKRIEIYSDNGKHLRSFPVKGHHSDVSVSRDGLVFVCLDRRMSADCVRYSLEGKLIPDDKKNVSKTSIPKMEYVGGNDYELSSVYDTSAGKCVTIKNFGKDVFSCVGAPLNWSLSYQFNSSGHLYLLNDNGVALINPDYSNGVLLKDLPNYRNDCEPKLDFKDMTMEKLIGLVYSYKQKYFEREGPELRDYLLKQNPNELRLLRNAIVARDNCKFKDKKLEKYFRDRFPEYRPVVDSSRMVFTLWDSNDINYVRAIEETLLGREIEDEFLEARRKPTGKANKIETYDLTKIRGGCCVRTDSINLTLNFPPNNQVMKGVNHLLAAYSPRAGYVLLHGDNKSGDNKDGTNLWLHGLNKFTGFEFYTNKYSGQTLQFNWKDEFTFSVKYFNQATKSYKTDTYKRELDKWYIKSAWKLIE